MGNNSTFTAEPVARLIAAMHKLPGIGPKSAQRLAYYLLQADQQQVKELADAILLLKQQISLCSVCLNISDADTCFVCRDSQRDATQICVVEKPMDILPLERTRVYKGLYHVLHGTIAPSEGIGPDQIRIRELLARLQSGTVHEVILATNPNVEGEATALYLQKLISPIGIKVTRLARGLPFGADLEYTDEVTLSGALQGRQQLTG
ncbi:MAG: recombination mediator RecR [Dehalococcoidia bacterium]|nr:recombination mediator RecR [Dehalococcoidia bacterium]